MTKRFLAIHKEKGIFLGVAGGYAFFSKENPGSYRAFSFESEDIAKLYIENRLTGYADDTMYVPVESKDVYISVQKIIKAGYKDYVHDMMDFLPMLTNTIQ